MLMILPGPNPVPPHSIERSTLRIPMPLAPFGPAPYPNPATILNCRAHAGGVDGEPVDIFLGTVVEVVPVV